MADPPVAGTSYSFAAFSGGSYSTATVTKAGNILSINTEFNGSAGSGTPVNTTFTDLVTITFTTLNPAGNSNLVWTKTEVVGDDYVLWPPVAAWVAGDRNLNTTPLPVQLASFAATFTPHANQVTLHWSTVSETNNYGYEVQKAKDSTSSYETIENSFVAGHGTTIEPHSYTFTDLNR